MSRLGGHKGKLMLELAEHLNFLNWNELKVCMRRKFVLPSYEKKKKLREEIEELVRKERKFINEKKRIRKKLQALIKKKEKKEERERKDR